MAVTHGGDIFAIAREHGWAWQEITDFSASINPLGPAPGVNAAIRNGLERIAHYPEREPVRLRQALANCWAVDEDQILLGNGATELIFFIARVVSGTEATLAAPVFSEFHRAFPTAKMARLEELETWASAGMVVLTRPANPTGWCLPLEVLDNCLANRPKLGAIVDESFLEFSGHVSAATLLRHHPQGIVLRSLTKFYALPGLRVGALVASAERIRSWKNQREPWQVNVLAEEAAIAAVADVTHAARSLAFVKQERHWLLEQIAALPFAEPLASEANFLYVRLGYPAQALRDYFLKHKILIRDCSDWPGLQRAAVRIAVRRHDENQRLIKAWRAFRCD
jgi:threonine-phosphate decarboxylase